MEPSPEVQKVIPVPPQDAKYRLIAKFIAG